MNKERVDRGRARSMLYHMMLIRVFETVVSQYKMERQIYGMAHCYHGEEAVAVGVCEALKTSDYIVSNHRPHGHAIAKGVDPRRMMAELFGRATGTNAGKGGSMHINDREKGMITATGIVGSGLPVACGAAFASQYKHDGRVTCVFFGDGAANEGVLHECLNLAAIWKLPIIFVLEHNGLAVTTLTKDTSACSDYTKLAAVYGIHAAKVDGQDVEAVLLNASEAVELARDKSLPTLLQAQTIRFQEHAEGEWYQRMIKTCYRDYAEVERERTERCPIRLYANHLLQRGIMTEDDICQTYKEAEAEVQGCLEYAMASPPPNPASAFEFVYR